MSKSVETPLNIEWTPNWVRALDITTGNSAQGRSFEEISGFLAGRKLALVGIGRSNVFLKSARLPKAAADDVRRILSVQIASLFPLPADQLSFDFFQTTDVTAEGCLTVIAAMRADDLRTLRAELKRAGITAARIVPMSLAAPSVAARSGNKNAVVVEQEAESVSLDVVLDGNVRFSRVASAAAAIPGEVQRTMAASKASDAVIIAVGAVDLPQSTPSIDSSLSLLHLSPPFNFELAEDLVLADKKRVAAKMRMAFLMAAAAVLLLALVWSNAQDEQDAVNRAQGKIARQMTIEKSILSTESGKASDLGNANDSLNLAFSPAQPISDLADVVTDSLPSDTWLTGLTIERGKALDIRGASKSSDSVGRFVDTLSSSIRFRDVKLVFANSALIGKEPVVQFNVSATAVGNLPMPAPVKGTTRAAYTTTTASTGGAS